MKKIEQIMKHFTLLLAGLLLIVGCAAPITDLDVAKEALAKLETERKDLDLKIKEIEERIDELDTTEKEDRRSLVVVKQPKVREFKHMIQIPGRADSRQNIVVSAEAMGNITKIAVQEGEMVRKGQVIAYIKSDVIGSQIGELKTRLELATQLYEKQKRLWDQKIGSEIQYLQAKNNKESLEKNIDALQAQQRNATIVAPISGYLDRVLIREGQLVNMGTPAARVVDLDHILVEAEVSEAYIGNFKKGDTTIVHFPSAKLTYKVPIRTIGQIVNPDDRTFLVEVALDNKDGRIKPNVLADMKIVTYRNPNAISLPTSVVQQGKNSDFVYVIRTEGSESFVKKKSVKVGMTYNGQTEILEGISNKDEVIVVGNRNVADGESVRIKK